FVQEAGTAALRGPQDVVDAMVAEFRRRRDAIVARLARIPGVRCHAPAGAFYAFPDVRALPIPAAAFADRLLEEETVALLDGSARGAPDISGCPSPLRSTISRRRRTASSASSHGCERLAGPRKGATPSPARARRRPGCGCRRPACPSTCARVRRAKEPPAAGW